MISSALRSVRLLLGLATAGATPLLARAIGVERPDSLLVVILGVVVFVVVFVLLLPLLIVGRDPERVLEVLLPSFSPVARALSPVTYWTARSVSATRPSNGSPSENPAEEANENAKAFLNAGEEEGVIAGEERRLLQSIVDFGDTLVREVMTPGTTSSAL